MDGDSSTQQQNLLQLCHVSLKANENEPELLCSICDEPVDSLGHFEQHLESINQHIKSKRLSKRFKNCKTCGLRCATSVQLMKHMQLHHKKLYNEKKQPTTTQPKKTENKQKREREKKGAKRKRN